MEVEISFQRKSFHCNAVFIVIVLRCVLNKMHFKICTWKYLGCVLGSHTPHVCLRCVLEFKNPVCLLLKVVNLEFCLLF